MTTRLSVNVNDHTSADIKELMARKGLTATEVIRRATAVSKFLDGAQRRGERLQVVEVRGGGTYVADVHIIG